MIDLGSYSGLGIWSNSNSADRTPVRKAIHSVRLNLNWGPVGFFESRTKTNDPDRLTSTQLLFGPLAELFFQPKRLETPADMNTPRRQVDRWLNLTQVRSGR